VNGKPYTRLLLIRHAEVELRYHNDFGGSIDMQLSPRGHEQAAALAKFLERRPPDALYASPMIRVRQTLEPFLKNGGPRLKTLSGLREVDFGAWTGLGWDAVQQRFGVSAFTWLEQLERNTIPDAESFAVFRGRVERALRAILAAQPGRTTAVFCHGGVIRMLLALLLDLPLRKTDGLSIEYASITEVALKPEHNSVQLLNFTPWRDHPA
jgi:broad specificity phosphatase PhoE